MNLVRRINTYYLIFLLLLFPIMVVVDYFLIRFVVNYELNDVLLHESERIKFSLDHGNDLPKSNYIYHFSNVTDNELITEAFNDTLIYDAYNTKLIPYRTYQFITDSGNQKLRISLRHVLLEMNELVLWLSVSTAFILLLLMTGLFLIQQRTYKWAWGPFFENLASLKNYDITDKDPVYLKPSNTNEFIELDKVVSTLMDQVKRDFQNLKEFNENISHEIQTPLAIIRNKMVLLLDSQTLEETELEWVQAVYQETNKLSKISKSLTLISRIENQEFTRLEHIDFKTIIENIIHNMKEMISFKNLTLNVTLNHVKVECDQTLANILFTNLIKNAVQHNKEGGYIKIILTKDRFETVNSGGDSTLEPSQIFTRFQRGKSSKNSLGLGLAINQRICELYGFELNYNHQNGAHKFSLFFKDDDLKVD